MMHPLDIHWVYTFGSVALISGASFTGMVALSWSPHKLARVIPPLLSLAAGALLGTAFGHLLPESIERVGVGRKLSALLLAGFLTFFVIERLLGVWLSRSGGAGGLHHHHHVPALPPGEGATVKYAADVNRPMITNLLSARRFTVSWMAWLSARPIRPERIWDSSLRRPSGFTKLLTISAMSAFSSTRAFP